MGTTLVVNPGSSSKKYALFHDGKLQIDMRFENTESGFACCTQQTGIQQVCEPVQQEDFDSAIARVRVEVGHYISGHRLPPLSNIVIRVVAPGTLFQRHAEITDEYVKALRMRESSAPLHIPVILREINELRREFSDIRMLAASDSAFHATLPPHARRYSIKRDDADQFDLHRFGYHGLSVASVVRRIHPLIGQDPERMIVCHLGSGCSVTALKNGESLETTMGFSPSSGLVMGTRAGDMDATAVLELMRQKNFRPAEAEVYLNTNGGLQGLAGYSDIRHLLERANQHDDVAIETLRTFTYHIQQAIAAQTVALGGVDVLVLTATAAVRSSALRLAVTHGLEHLGIQVSPERNDSSIGQAAVISRRNSAVKVVVMRTDELGEMALLADTYDLSQR